MIFLIKNFAFLLCVVLLVIGYSYIASPPMPSVKAEGRMVATTPGSYCWESTWKAECVDMSYASPWEQGVETAPAAVKAGAAILIDFNKQPLPGSLSAELWTSKTNSEPALLRNGLLTAPKAPGIYVFHIFADWKQGGGNYAFSIEVK
ncbi:hypothetical protein HU147_16525 [Planomicrobium chinense]|uniref:hypothetical protein n=1 Tax=Planococcus chinensis TaxID=272917 RepID=UPI001CC54310|nr:hypothetical protein [Planococcus chinensis]MBZ5202813.1 hypothetical protein [Planococcus chinensis]